MFQLKRSFDKMLLVYVIIKKFYFLESLYNFVDKNIIKLTKLIIIIKYLKFGRMLL